MRLSTKILATLGLMSWATSAFSGTKGNEWLIRTSLGAPTAAELSSRLGVDILKVVHVSDDLYKVVTGPQNVNLKARIEEREDGTITRVQRNFIYRPSLMPMNGNGTSESTLAVVDNPAIEMANANPARGVDPKASAQWGLAKTEAATAWATQRGDHNVIVAVIDTGIDYNHEDLKSNVWHNPNEIPGNGIDDDYNGYVDDVIGWDFADNDALPYDKMSAQRFDGNPGHGTHCSGVVGANGDNAIGISGMAPDITVMGLRFITDKGEGTTEAAILAIKYAVANGAKVLSNSWGGEADSEDDTELKAAIQEAQDAGVLLIFAAGNGRNGAGYSNDSDAHPGIPASYDFDAIISVAASDSSDKLGSFSNFGTRTVDLAAPGVKIMSSVPLNKYEDSITIFGIPIASWDGTSMATPHVAGAAALVWSQYPELTAAQVKARLLNSVTPIAGLATKVKTGGVLNVARALQ